MAIKCMLGNGWYQEVSKNEQGEEVVRYMKNGTEYTKEQWEQSKTTKGDMAMNKKLYAIEDHANEIKSDIEIVEGQMMYFDSVINDIERYPDVAAAYLKAGILGKQLNAIYALLIDRLDNITERSNKIDEICESSIEGDNGEKSSEYNYFDSLEKLGEHLEKHDVPFEQFEIVKVDTIGEHLQKKKD